VLRKITGGQAPVKPVPVPELPDTHTKPEVILALRLCSTSRVGEDDDANRPPPPSE
jgi:hypothetical protein